MLASRTHWRLLTATIVALMAAAFLAPRWVRPPDIQENRVLAAKPAWPKAPQDFKAFRKAADAYVADRFPIRPHLIGLLNRVRMVAGVSGSNRVIVGREGWLFFDDDSHMGAARNDPPMEGPQVRAWLMTLAGRTEFARAHGATYLVLAPPYKEMVYPQYGPSWYAGPAPNRPGVVLPRFAAASGAGEVLSLYPAVAAATRRGEKTYSLHDTHWNGFGAYAGYAALMDRLHAMGFTDGPLPASAFTLKRETGAGQPRDLALMLGVASMVHLDYPEFSNPTGQAKLHITYLSAKQDWTGPQVWDTGEVGKPTLLMLRDSYSNELMGFLVPHFSRIILAHNQDGFWRPDLIEQFKPNLVISEVIEPGLRVAVGDGPQPSPEAAARIDHVLGAIPPPAASAKPRAPVMPSLTPDGKLLATLNAAKPTPNCNLEVATLTPGTGGEATLTISGWISELGPSITSPFGAVRLRGPAGDVVAPIRVDLSRPDVAAFFKTPTGEKSGFLGTFLIGKLPKGSYTPLAYRRSPGGWIACEGRQALVAP